MQIDYIEVFRPRPSAYPLLGLLFILIGLFLATKSRRRFFGLLFLAFASLWTLGTAYLTISRYLYLKRVAEDPRTPVLEGTVTVFSPAPFGGHQNEVFEVAGKHFAYSDYRVTGGFNQTTSHGGPLREGLRVRVRWTLMGKDPTIVSLDTAATTLSNP